MSCVINNGINRNGCRLRGGIKEIYFMLPTTLSPGIYQPTTVSNEITSLGTSAVGELELYKFENLHGVGSAIETMEASAENNVAYYNQVITAALRGLSASRLQTIDEIIKSTVAAVVHYESGISRLFGEEFFLDCTSSEDSSGEGAADGNIVNIELTGMEVEKAKIIAGSTLALPLGTISTDEYTIITES